MHKKSIPKLRKEKGNPSPSPSLCGPSIQRHPLAIQSPIYSPQHDLQDPIRIQPRCPTLTSPRHRIDDIPEPAASLRDTIVEILQRLRRTGLFADLEELDAHLPHWRVELVQFLGVRDDDGFRIVAWNAVGDDDDVERLHVIQVRLVRFALPQIRLENRVELGTGESSTAGSDRLEDALNLVCTSDVLVAR